jgi:hypothetical protein
MTPFGSDVDPDVYCKKATSAGFVVTLGTDDVVPFDAFCFSLLKMSSTGIHVRVGHCAERVENMFWSALSFFA